MVEGKTAGEPRPGGPDDKQGRKAGDALEAAETEAASLRAGRRLLLSSLRHERRGIAYGVVAGLVWTAAKVSVPSLARRGIDQGIVHDQSGALLKWSLIMLAVGAVSATCTGLRRWYAFGVAWRVEASLRHRLV